MSEKLSERRLKDPEQPCEDLDREVACERAPSRAELVGMLEEQEDQWQFWSTAG